MKIIIKKAFCIFLCAFVIAASITMGAFAKNNEPQSKYTYVFVHGLCGWGQDDGAYELFPYWGMTTGNIFAELERNGYNCVAADVGAVSSAWDRACELYAQLVGTRVDYGAAHSAEHNHARYGKTFDKPIVEKWDSANKVNFVAHSFGGVTVRLLIQLLAEGSEEEIAATDASELSPLFKGGMADRVYSVTTLASPHNGSSFFEALGRFSNTVTTALGAMAYLCATTPLKHFFDPMLEQFNFIYNPNVKPEKLLDKAALKRFVNSEDNAFYDLTIDGAAKLNEKIKIQPDILFLVSKQYNNTEQMDGEL